MQKLQAAGYVHVAKEFVEGRPRTMLAITERGREAVRAYRAELLRVLGGLPE